MLDVTTQDLIDVMKDNECKADPFGGYLILKALAEQKRIAFKPTIADVCTVTGALHLLEEVVYACVNCLANLEPARSSRDPEGDRASPDDRKAWHVAISEAEEAAGAIGSLQAHLIRKYLGSTFLCRESDKTTTAR